MCVCFVNKQQVLVECGQRKKVLAVSGDYSSLERILKEAFEIDREIIIQKYEADWEDFVDLDDFVDFQDRWGNLIPRVREFDSKFLFLIKVPTLSRAPSPSGITWIAA